MAAIATGSVISFAGNPGKLAALEAQGWIKCDGRPLSRIEYPELYLAIGTTYGGNGSPNFNLPDMRGYFQRGVDDGSGRDPDRGARTGGDRVGSTQQDQLRNHKHDWDHFFYWLDHGGDDIAVHQPSDSRNLQTHTRQATNYDGGGNETRPKNVYQYFLIASGVRSMIALTQLSDGTLLGVGADRLLYTRRDLNSTWSVIRNSGDVVGITQLRDGRIVGIGTDSWLWVRDTLSSGWRQVPNSCCVIAVTQLSDGRILGVGTDHLLYTRADLNSTWVQVPASGAVIGVVQLPDGRILGAGTDNLLYTRDTLTSGWVQVPGSGAVIAIAQLKSGLLAGIRTDRNIYTRGALDAPWVRGP